MNAVDRDDQTGTRIVFGSKRLPSSPRNFLPEALTNCMNRNDQNSQNWSSGLGFLLVAGCCMVMLAYVLFVQTGPNFNWMLLIMLASACPIVHLFAHHGDRQRN